MTRALFLFGGFQGHSPDAFAEWARPLLSELGFEVDEITDPNRLEADLTVYDLIVMGWTSSSTHDSLTPLAERRLAEAIGGGTGLAGWHGMTASFRSSLQYCLLTGGSFLSHPGGEAEHVPYSVDIVDRDHPITEGVDSFTVASEQYYMHVDPAVHVLATTTFTGEHFPWIDGVVMPAAYTHRWGRGRVFYFSPGHFLEDVETPHARRLIRQGLVWAARG